MKNREDGKTSYHTLSRAMFLKLKELVPILSKHMVEETSGEYPLNQTEMRTISLEKFEHDRKWYAGFLSYKKKKEENVKSQGKGNEEGEKEVNGFYSMNIPLDAFKSLLYAVIEIDEATMFFGQKRRETALARAPPLKLGCQALKKGEVLSYQWAVSGPQGDFVRWGEKGFWDEEVCKMVGESQLNDNQRADLKVVVFKTVVQIENQLEVTRHAACFLMYLRMREKNHCLPCPKCFKLTADGDTLLPCVSCLYEDIPKACHWRTEPEFRQIFSSPEFETKLGSFLDYIRKAIYPMTLYGRDMAIALVAYSCPNDMKSLYWKFLETHKDKPMLMNLYHSFIQFQQGLRA